MERLGYPKSIDGNHAFIKAFDEDLRKMIDQNHGLIKAHDEEMERIKQMADDMFTMEQESMGHCFPHKRRKIEKLLLMSEIINLRHNKMMADERMSILAQEHQTEKDEFERRIKELERKVDDKRVEEVEIQSLKEEIKVKPKVEAIEEEEVKVKEEEA
ncbi:hypothetical protein ES288_D10G231200v1 [Gossypium darwinii]|uniref:Uncharacterized protein n=1 Tax=Gossypium darwinii TaxID=34276 RepID=A0A5D2B177_GOSDA|nr:hypothetical protein ES288_D10G231200v1 [Gossypium darwinii]